MKKTLLFGLLLLGIFISGCIAEPQGCNHDGVCSLNERYLGNCGDCMPDFSIEPTAFGSYYDNQLHLDYCIKNTNGEYIGPLDIEFRIDNSGNQYSYTETDSMYFDSTEFQSYITYNVKKGKIDFDINTNFATQNDQYACYHKSFWVTSGGDYSVILFVNPSNRVEEKDYGNNQHIVFVPGVSYSYPDIVFEYPIANYNYFSSHYWNYQGYETYSAHYYNTNNQYPPDVSANVNIYYDTYAQQAQWNALMSLPIEPITVGNYVIYRYTYHNGNYVGYFWQSQQHMIITIAEAMDDPYLLAEYYLLNRYPSDYLSITPGGPSYPEYLIEKNIGDFKYVQSRYSNIGFGGYSFGMYSAEYTGLSNAHAIHYVFDSPDDREKFVKEIYYQGNPQPTTLYGFLVFVINQDYVYYWYVGKSQIIEIRTYDSNRPADDIAIAYLKRFGST